MTSNRPNATNLRAGSIGLFFSAAAVCGLARADSPASQASSLPTVHEMIAAQTDVWGDGAQRQPNGASYEFFKDLLPPLRWVNTDFRHYPIVLSAPRAEHKARLVSNGSAVNARANKPPMWYEQGVPVTFLVGDSSETLGEDIARLQEPAYLDGYLPVVTIMYERHGAIYQQESFAPVDDQDAEHGTLMLRFTVRQRPGRIEARINAEPPLRVESGEVLDAEGQCLARFSPTWRWKADRSALVASFNGDETAELAVFTKPIESGGSLTPDIYNQRKQQCIDQWNELLARGVQLETPEPLVNNAWRSMLIGNFMMAVGDRAHYSAGNAYAKLYQGECGDTLRSLMLFGHLDVAPEMLKPLLEFNRQATRFHVAGHKLQLLAYYYWLTRDAETVHKYESIWRPFLELILTSREAETGLLPKDSYAGDISTPVYSLNSNANCWRSVRDVATMLEEIGEKEEAEELRRFADDFRESILKATARSERHETDPPFIPLALLSDEPVYDPLTATRNGSYYDLMCPYVIGSEVFGQGSEREDWLLGYMQTHGGISMGMPRVFAHQGQFVGEPGVNPLYGLRYQLALVRRDEREKALVGIYGQLAQGMTRNTFIGGEGSRFLHGDEHGRTFYLPPNSTSNAAWLIVLRHLLVQDWDLNEDGRPDTLRLLFAAPRRWLEDGRQIRVKNAPTQFGKVSCEVKSRLNEGHVEVRVTPPPRAVEKLLLRAPVPDGWQVDAAEVDGRELPLVDGNVVDLSGRREPLRVRFAVSRTD